MSVRLPQHATPYSPNTYTAGTAHFPSFGNLNLIALGQWQYWWWFWFTFLLVLYLVFTLRLLYTRTLSFHPKITTSLRSHGRWGDLIICLLPIFWCVNILTNSHFLLRHLEWQTENSLFTLRVRGKQWYWVYKFDLGAHAAIEHCPVILGRNKKVTLAKTTPAQWSLLKDVAASTYTRRDRLEDPFGKINNRVVRGTTPNLTHLWKTAPSETTRLWGSLRHAQGWPTTLAQDLWGLRSIELRLTPKPKPPKPDLFELMKMPPHLQAFWEEVVREQSEAPAGYWKRLFFGNLIFEPRRWPKTPKRWTQYPTDPFSLDVTAIRRRRLRNLPLDGPLRRKIRSHQHSEGLRQIFASNPPATAIRAATLLYTAPLLAPRHLDDLTAAQRLAISARPANILAVRQLISARVWHIHSLNDLLLKRRLKSQKEVMIDALRRSARPISGKKSGSDPHQNKINLARACAVAHFIGTPPQRARDVYLSGKAGLASEEGTWVATVREANKWALLDREFFGDVPAADWYRQLGIEYTPQLGGLSPERRAELTPFFKQIDTVLPYRFRIPVYVLKGLDGTIIPPTLPGISLTDPNITYVNLNCLVPQPEGGDGSHPASTPVKRAGTAQAPGSGQERALSFLIVWLRHKYYCSLYTNVIKRLLLPIPTLPPRQVSPHLPPAVKDVERTMMQWIIATWKNGVGVKARRLPAVKPKATVTKLLAVTNACRFWAPTRLASDEEYLPQPQDRGVTLPDPYHTVRYRIGWGRRQRPKILPPQTSPAPNALADRAPKVPDSARAHRTVARRAAYLRAGKTDSEITICKLFMRMSERERIATDYRHAVMLRQDAHRRGRLHWRHLHPEGVRRNATKAPLSLCARLAQAQKRNHFAFVRDKLALHPLDLPKLAFSNVPGVKQTTGEIRRSLLELWRACGLGSSEWLYHVWLNPWGNNSAVRRGVIGYFPTGTSLKEAAGLLPPTDAVTWAHLFRASADENPIPLLKPITKERWVRPQLGPTHRFVLHRVDRSAVLNKQLLTLRLTDGRRQLRDLNANTHITFIQKKTEPVVVTAGVTRAAPIGRGGQAVVVANAGGDLVGPARLRGDKENTLTWRKRQAYRKELAQNKRLLWVTKQIVLPIRTPITIITNSYDVIHSWFLPGLGLKMDCVPGRSTHHTIFIDRPGYYYGQCAEVCGRRHHHMPIKILAVPFVHFVYWWNKKVRPRTNAELTTKLT